MVADAEKTQTLELRGIFRIRKVIGTRDSQHEGHWQTDRQSFR